MTAILERYRARTGQGDHSQDPARLPDPTALLSTRGLTRRYGGVSALDGVDLDLREGAILGLIGPNGAGKTTLFECIAGFNRADAGTVHFAGEDITRLSPEARGRRGLIRSFQDARLFPSLTVHQCVIASQERARPSRLLDSVFSLPVERRREQEKRERADELISSMGLDAYRDKLVREISTGTRRIVELACVLALDPRLLLLDEPSSGIAQKETEALGPVLRKVKEITSCTMIIIEHDIPLVMSLAEEIVAMESGKIIARGTPEEVRNDARVIASYLGANEVTIERSGPASSKSTARTDGDGRCEATTAAGTRCTNKVKEGGRACGIAAHKKAVG